MSEKIFNNDEEDEITYRTTDFLKTSEDHGDMYPPRKKSGGLLITLIFLLLIVIILAVYIYISKSNEIKGLRIAQINLESRSKLSDKNYSEKISSLESDLKDANSIIESLTSKNKDFGDQVSKIQSSLTKTETDKKTLETDLKDSNQKISEKDSEIKKKESELNKVKNERKLAEDDLRDAGEKISGLENENNKLKNDVSFWQKRYDKLNKEQTDAVNEILASAQQRQKLIDQMEQDLLKSYEKAELYYSLIGWEENYKLTNRVPLSKLTQKPLLQTTSKPAFPKAALDKKIEGMVILKGILTEDGRLSNIDVLYSPQNSIELGDAAKAAASQYRYKPAQKDGASVKVVLVVPVDFQIKSNF